MHILIRSAAFGALLALLSPCVAADGPPPAADGSFQPSLDSLQRYSCPDWFRDAKFGIWAHWGPQAVPMDGDWYARGMYEPGNRHYAYHVEHYGHPSKFGYKDIIPLWKAEKWDPDRLMALYKKAGARYFVSMGSHHDNFFLWNSKLHRWNSVAMGPRRDVVGEWRQAARKHGLRFGVSEHLGASFTWFQASHGADKSGPLAGVPYDGADPQYQDLYHAPAEPGDKNWYSTNPAWQRHWYAAIQELVDTYQPDLLYTDGGVPFGNEVGLGMIAHFYNSDARRRGGATEAVYACKQKSGGRWVEDIERGIMPGIDPHPWQTDTSIGDWYYNRNWKFRPVSWVIHMLVDNVSKNGNLLLNVVQRPDGSLDPEVERMLGELADWTAIHGEAIYGTRPWTVFGEGAVRAKGGAFKEDFRYDAREIRFTTKGATLYAIALGWPEDGKLVVRSLAKPDGQEVNLLTGVRLLGYDGEVKWHQSPDGLVVDLPATRVSGHTAALRITGTNLQAVPLAAVAIKAGPDGAFTLGADAAELHGGQVNHETQGGVPNIGFWDRSEDWVSWTVRIDKPGTYQVSATIATTHQGARFAVEAGGQAPAATAPATGGWDKFRKTEVGTIEFKTAGPHVVKVRATDAASWKAINLAEVKLTPQEPAPVR